MVYCNDKVWHGVGLEVCIVLLQIQSHQLQVLCLNFLDDKIHFSVC